MAARAKLSPRHRLFVKEYIKDRNGARAYRAVYGVAKGADQSAAKLLRTPKVAEAVEKSLAKLELKLEISAEKVLARLEAFASVQLSEKERKSSAGLNALRANELLAKHFKLLTDKVEHSGQENGINVNITLPSNGSEKKPE